MAEEGSGGIDLNRELTCAICTDILYQPLTLLDCLHTFCGSCLREWFEWQATSAAHTRRTTRPYTCPSCRDKVRDTKPEWRVTTLLEMYLKANPDKAKSEQEKNEVRQLYKPGDDVLKPVKYEQEDVDSEDERILADVRELSMADVDPETARRRAERNARHRGRQDDSRTHQPPTSEELRRRQHQHAQLTESRLREHNREEIGIEHQPSLRSLLSASDVNSHDVQTEIIQQIYAEGVLDGLDLEHLTTQQEEELAERIADAYMRRQRQRERSRNRERRHRDSVSPRSRAEDSPPQNRAQPDPTSVTQQTNRSRPPISNPRLLEQSWPDPARRDRRSASATSARSNRSETRNDGPSPATRSATDLSQQPGAGDTQRPSRRRVSSSGRSATVPEGSDMREQIHRVRTSSNNAATENAPRRSPRASVSLIAGSVQGEATSRNSSISSLPRTVTASNADSQHSLHPAVSTAAFAPEAISDLAPSIPCNRCKRLDIQYNLHYNCPWCLNGAFNLCLQCYRAGQGCDHWFGFGFRAYDRWHRNAPPEGWPGSFERPHVLTPRRYIKARDRSSLSPNNATAASNPRQEGAFCESCFSFADGCYWYCNICLEGAWGFCDSCVKQGRHCTHPLLLVAHIDTLQQPHYDPTKSSYVGLPHLRPECYVTQPVPTNCDICHIPLPLNSTRFHCYKCSNGNYDMCHECYSALVAQGRISQANGPNGWRRCLQGHRMAVIGYQDILEGGHLRMTAREPVGGWTFKEDDISMSSQIPSGGLPPDGGIGMRCLAIYSYFPGEGVTDELAFPKNAEIREVENKNGDWFWGVFAGAIKLFPSNHVRTL